MRISALARSFLLPLCLTWAPLPVAAQVENTDTGGFIDGLIENALSGDNRSVQVIGLNGALSSTATIEQIIISDDDGVWLTLTGAELDWTRSALLRGRLSIQNLSAESIEVTRRPGPTTAVDEDLPTAEAQPFQIPELPVAVNIESLRIDRISLAEPVAGTAAELSVEGNLTLADGALDTDLAVNRLDRDNDRITLTAGFANETNEIVLDLDISEEENGLISGLLGIPGRPSVELTAAGRGPVSDFTADLSLATDGTQRVTGQVTLNEARGGGTAFGATIEGDLTPMLDPKFHEFFGENARIAVTGETGTDGSLSIPQFSIASSALDLSGEFGLAPGGTISRVMVQGEIAPAEGATVTLPTGEPATSIQRLDIAGGFDADEGNQWDLVARVVGLSRPDVEIGNLTLTGSGTLQQGDATSLSGEIDARAQELLFTDGKLQQAVGEAIQLVGQFGWQSGGTLDLTEVTLTGTDYSAFATTRIDGLNSGFRLDGSAEVNAEDLSRFSGLAGRSLGGAISAQVEGQGSPLGGSFDVRLSGNARDLETGIEQADAVIGGETTILLDAARGTDGITLREFELNGEALTANANGSVSSTNSSFTFEAALDDLGRVLPEAPGPVTLNGDVTHQNQTISGQVSLRAPQDTSLDLGGSYTADGVVDTTYQLVVGELQAFIPQIQGSLSAEGEAERNEQSNWTVTSTLGGTAGLDSTLEASFDETTGTAEIDFNAGLERLERLVPQLVGDITARGQAERTAAREWRVTANTGGTVGIKGDFDGTYEEETGIADLNFDAAFERLERLVPQLVGTITARGTASRSEESVWQASVETGGTAGVQGQFDGSFDQVSGAAELDLDAVFERLERFVPQLQGNVSARGRVERSEELTWTASLDTGGSAGISGNFDGSFEEPTGAASLDLDANFERLQRLVPQLEGNISARGNVERSEELTWTASLETGGSAGIGGSFDGSFEEPTGVAALDFDATFERLQRFVPQLAGDVSAKGQASRSAEQQWNVNFVTDGSAGIAATLDGDFDETSGDASATFDATVERIQRLVPEFAGTLTASGEASKSGTVYSITTSASGPGGIVADVDGSYDQASNQADIEATGQAQLGLANAFISPNSLRGLVSFDLSVNGPPAVESVSGTVSTSGATAVVASVGKTLTGINTTVNLSGGSAQISTTGALSDGGQFRVSGPVSLAAPYNAGIDIQLLNLIIKDNISFETVANGNVNINGALLGGATIGGQINFGETRINIAAASGSVSAAPIPEIRHVGESGAQRATRARAGLIKTSSGSSGPVYNLDLTMNAPNRIFVRGRGLNAELGGQVLVRGTTANVVPSGGISLIRGYFDILGRRLELDEGQVQLAGSLEPFLNFVASTSTSEGEATLTISGPASQPAIEVTSSPERPTEEALALLLFGDKFEDLSPLKIAQLGAQLATLGGAGGGLVNSVQEGLGVDSFDVGTDDDGNAQVGVGGYISENIYSDVSVNAKGDTEVNLNLDITDSLTAKGSVDSEGETGLGLFFEKDY
ncbi:MAG: translocation/assembly module TamB domain-containing protein [Heliomarina sp.]|uniref:translocation/assembly module TamB domain-containing protein n=1 Tax=Heliomarina sp. TaxID=2917556 RepID=UPI0040598CD5